jgi:RND family efflux transporter MFP subunit
VNEKDGLDPRDVLSAGGRRVARRPTRAACVLGFLVLFAGCQTSEIPKNLSPAPVTIANPTTRPVTDYIEFTGTVAPYQSADLVARVEGYLEEIHFKDGAFVDKGQLLFTIEQDTYEQELKSREAQLTRAQEEYDRQRRLVKQNATNRDEAAAQVALAEIKLGYTNVKAPFSGLMGRHLVDVGNLVGLTPTAPTKLATIEQIVPIYVYFNVSSRDALRIRDTLRAQGINVREGIGKAPVFVGLENESGYPHRGTLDFANNRVSTSTGTIQLRAVFENTDKTLLPGLFARVRIPLGKPKPSLLIPDTAIKSDQAGDYVLIVNSQDVVERRRVETGPLVESDRAITKGLSENDRVIVEGLARARPGQKVTPKTTQG